jgi:hypothetical protein
VLTLGPFHLKVLRIIGGLDTYPKLGYDLKDVTLKVPIDAATSL